MDATRGRSTGFPDDILPLEDPARLGLLARILQGDPLLRGGFDRVTAAVVTQLEVPVSLVSLVDPEQQHFVGNTGITGEFAAGTPLSHSFCRHVVTSNAPLIIRSATEHPLVAGNPAIEDLGVVAYAGEPIRLGDHVLGSLCAIDHVPRDWTEHQLRMLRAMADIAEYMISTRFNTVGKIVDRQAETQARERTHAATVARYEAEASERSVVAGMSRRLQRALLAHSGTVGGYEVEVFYSPGSDRLLLGGDFVATWATGAGALDFVIGDVSGHGPEAAGLAVGLRSSWRALRGIGADVATVLAALESIVSESDLHATALVGSIDAGGTLRFASAGHPAPLLSSGDGANELTMTPGPMLGLRVTEPAWPVTEAQLGSGQFIAYTDGLVEGRVTGRRDRFGVERLTAAIGRHGADLGALNEEAKRANGGPLEDDVALLRISRGAPAPQ